MGVFKNILRRIRRFGLFHKLGYARVWCQSRLFPPPPKGRFPPVWTAARKPHGLVAIGGELTEETLLKAYARGIYPFYDKPPIEWLSCNPRMVLFLEKMKLKKGLRPFLQSGTYTVTFDTAFEEVARQSSNREWTWLLPERIALANSLHHRGRAHSVEVWNRHGELVGGLFGMDMGRMFISESAFSVEPNAMKVACAYLNCHLQYWGYVLNDVQAFGEHFRRMGYEEIPRRNYIRLLPSLVSGDTRSGRWMVDERLEVGRWNPAEPGSQVRAHIANP